MDLSDGKVAWAFSSSFFFFFHVVMVVSLPSVDGDEMKPWLSIEEDVAGRVLMGGGIARVDDENNEGRVR